MPLAPAVSKPVSRSIVMMLGSPPQASAAAGPDELYIDFAPDLREALAMSNKVQSHALRTQA